MTKSSAGTPLFSQRFSRDMPTEKGAGSGYSPVRGLRLLVIDDDPARLDALAGTLRRMGAIVAVGGRSESGYKQAISHMPDAVISDIISPGEAGWSLVERLRRHPMLRWTPFLLLRWWQDDPREDGHVRIETLVERLQEVLAPQYVLRERIRTKKPLGGRLETIGPMGLLRVLTGARVTGALRVNDAWSVFDIHIKNGLLHTVDRTGIAASRDKGGVALLQMLLSDAGKWSFQPNKPASGLANIASNLEKALSHARLMLSSLFESDTEPEDGSAISLNVRAEVLEAAVSMVSMTTQRIAELLERSANNTEIDVFLADVADTLDLERALQALVRCGVVVPEDRESAVLEKKTNPKIVACATHLFESVSARRVPSPEVTPYSDRIDANEAPPSRPAEPARAGQYYFENMPPEQVTAPDMDAISLELSHDTGPSEPNIERPASLSIETTPYEPETRPAPSLAALKRPGKRLASLLAQFKRLPSQVLGKIVPQKQLPRDSIGPMPALVEKKMTGQMWLAIGLAAALGTLVIAGLFFVAS
ncbi:MAG: hypothetical protein QNJ97_19785 [Myxococcota bacterium]|nr:hypothetical protein [Myxococcota bacterium]